MSLAARLAKSCETVVCVSDERALLPVDLVRDLLQSTIVHLVDASLSEVHAALVQLLTFCERSSSSSSSSGGASVESQASSLEPLHPSFVTCKECRRVGTVRLDHHRGERVCVECGAVQGLRSENVEVEFDLQHPGWRGDDEASSSVRRDRWSPSGRRKQRPRHVRGVSNRLLWSLAAPEYTDPSQRPSRYWNELEHWNSVTRHPTDTLHRLDRLLKTWEQSDTPPPSTMSKSARLAAALALPFVESRRLQTDTLRAHLSKGSAIPIVADPEPEPRFECLGGCGTRLHTLKDARYHCKLSLLGRKRQRRL